MDLTCVIVIRTWKSFVLFLWRSGQGTSGLRNNERGLTFLLLIDSQCSGKGSNPSSLILKLHAAPVVLVNSPIQEEINDELPKNELVSGFEALSKVENEDFEPFNQAVPILETRGGNFLAKFRRSVSNVSQPVVEKKQFNGRPERSGSYLENLYTSGKDKFSRLLSRPRESDSFHVENNRVFGQEESSGTDSDVDVSERLKIGSRDASPEHPDFRDRHARPASPSSPPRDMIIDSDGESSPQRKSPRPSPKSSPRSDDYASPPGQQESPTRSPKSSPRHIKEEEAGTPTARLSPTRGREPTSPQSGPPSPKGKKPSSPNGKKPSSPDGKRPPSPDGKRPPSLDGKRPSSPDGKRPSSPDGKRPSSPNGKKPPSPKGLPSSPPARPPSPEQRESTPPPSGQSSPKGKKPSSPPTSPPSPEQWEHTEPPSRGWPYTSPLTRIPSPEQWEPTPPPPSPDREPSPPSSPPKGRTPTPPLSPAYTERPPRSPRSASPEKQDSLPRSPRPASPERVEYPPSPPRFPSSPRRKGSSPPSSPTTPGKSPIASPERKSGKSPRRPLSPDEGRASPSAKRGSPPRESERLRTSSPQNRTGEKPKDEEIKPEKSISTSIFTRVGSSIWKYIPTNGPTKNAPTKNAPTKHTLPFHPSQVAPPPPPPESESDEDEKRGRGYGFKDVCPPGERCDIMYAPDGKLPMRFGGDPNKESGRETTIVSGTQDMETQNG
ncbi:unnamed protein product [Bemisia tabaci]|uniref:Uncharacterized protein n=1 Tax=Bemisia tabaci TaxID=7038 RepID=A0A9P0AFF7_BEMTA|nr:unnamed protein product [Bemisia tabaci]